VARESIEKSATNNIETVPIACGAKIRNINNVVISEVVYCSSGSLEVRITKKAFHYLKIIEVSNGQDIAGFEKFK